MRQRTVAALGIAVVVGGILSALDTPVQLARVEVQLKDGSSRAGLLVAENSDGIYLGSRDRLVIVPRAEATTVRVRPPAEAPERPSIIDRAVDLL